MSFLDNAGQPHKWTALPARSSLRRDLGCVQCGSRLEINESNVTRFSGKCENCSRWIADEDEFFDELED